MTEQPNGNGVAKSLAVVARARKRATFWWSVAAACLCATVAILAVGLVLNRTYDSRRLHALDRDARCRNELAAEVDVAMGAHAVTVGLLIDAVSRDDPALVSMRVAELRVASLELRAAITARDLTEELCP